MLIFISIYTNKTLEADEIKETLTEYQNCKYNNNQYDDLGFTWKIEQYSNQLFGMLAYFSGLHIDFF